MAKDRIENQLGVATAIIDRLLIDSSMLATLGEFGYGQGKLTQAKHLRDQALLAQQQQRLAQGLLTQASKTREHDEQMALAEYRRCANVARLALVDDQAALQKLALESRRKRNRTGWMLQAHQLYGNALADTDLLDRLSEYTLDAMRLGAARDLLDTADASYAAYSRASEQAHEATRQRDLALAALAGWLRLFKPIARAALHEYPQFLELLSSARRAERNDTIPAA